MIRCLATYWIIVLLMGEGSIFAQQIKDREIQLLQAQVHALIEKAEPSIVCIAVSRSDGYRKYGQQPSADQPGKLGTFDRKHFHEMGDLATRELLRRLDLSDPDTVPDSYGSGVVIDPKGLILTNYHVIRDATKIFVRLPGGSGSYADLHAADARSDLAVLRLIVPPKNLKPITFSDGSAVKKGDFVISLANPFSVGFRDGSPSASWGMISNLKRRGPGPSKEIERNRPLSQYQILLQTDARLNLGCSGGAILNLNGEMIGLTTSTAAIQGGESAGGFALPMDKGMLRFIEVLKRGEEIEYGFLGISIPPNDPFLPEGIPGISVDGVMPGLPASRAGLQRGDWITRINGQPVKDYDDLFLSVGSQLAGTEVVLDVQSFNRSRKVTVRLAKANPTGLSIASEKRAPVFGIRVDYTSVLMTNNSIPLPTGVYVREIIKESPAESKLKPRREGDRMIITQVNGKAISNPADFFEAVKNKGSLELKVVDVVPNFESTERTVKLP